jgi:hypothetical protein
LSHLAFKNRKKRRKKQSEEEKEKENFHPSLSTKIGEIRIEYLLTANSFPVVVNLQ